MARKKKDTVDYFPHPVNNGSRMFIMEQTYGDKGYVAYYKLLEMIGRADGHFIDFNQKKDLLFFASQIRADQETTCQIIQTLAEINAIDMHLWVEGRIVWCSDFIEKIAPVYENRKRQLPQKPKLHPSENDNYGFSTVEIPAEQNNYDRKGIAEGQSKVINTQSKVKESRVKESTQVSEISTVEIPRASLLDIFFRDLPNSTEFENIVRNQQITKEWATAMIINFKASGAEPSYPNFQRFAAHFGNWLRKIKNQPATGTKKRNQI